MDRKLIDANIILRLLIKDNQEHRDIASQYFKELWAWAYIGVITPIILSECRYVMKSFYKITNQRIAQMLYITIHHPNIELEEKEECMLTLKLLEETSLDFADCYLLAKNTKKKYHWILTFDTKLTKLSRR